MMHTNYQPARKGLVSEKIKAEKIAAFNATHKARGGGREVAREVMREMSWDRSMGETLMFVPIQARKLRYSDQGDFTRCYRGGF